MNQEIAPELVYEGDEEFCSFHIASIFLAEFADHIMLFASRAVEKSNK